MIVFFLFPSNKNQSCQLFKSYVDDKFFVGSTFFSSKWNLVTSTFILKLNATFNLQKTLFCELLATFRMAIKYWLRSQKYAGDDFYNAN